MISFWRHARFVLALTLCFVIAGAAVPVFAGSFTREWKAALSGSAPNDGIQGAWEGIWRSKAHGVSGPLRCVIKDLGNGRYQAHFHARFHWFRFSYVAELLGQKTEQGIKLNGTADLGWMGGVYHYSGEASHHRYTSIYQSKVEHGVLELNRARKS